MLLGAIADDFTGASDLGNTLTKGGMATTQFVGIPSEPAEGDCEAGIVALKTRSIDANEATLQSLAALKWLRAQGCRQFLFKYCSTFDSTSKGNIGPVAEALLDALGTEIAVVCPAFPAAGRRIFMGHLFVGDRLLSESGMEKHPLTPMTDPDLRRWLARQARGSVGHVALEAVGSGPEAIRAALAREKAERRRLVVVDAVSDENLLAIGAAIADHQLVTGGSGIALGLAENFRRAGQLAQRRADIPPVPGPGIVLSGSCSQASQAQVVHYLREHPGLAVQPEALADEPRMVEHAAAFARTHFLDGPIFYSTAEPEEVAAAQVRFGTAAVSQRIEKFFGAVARRLADEGVRRIVVGGGETSGAVVAALGVKRLRIGREIDPGVPALMAERSGPLGLALKSGNFGAPDFYSKALSRLAGE